MKRIKIHKDASLARPLWARFKHRKALVAVIGLPLLQRHARHGDANHRLISVSKGPYQRSARKASP
jgi:hypothetical protein